MSSGRFAIGREIGPRRPARQNPRAFLGAEVLLAVADEIDAALEAIPVDDDAHQIAVDEPADGPARQRLGADVADAGARRDAGEARVGHHRDVLAEAQRCLSAEVIW